MLIVWCSLGLNNELNSPSVEQRRSTVWKKHFQQQKPELIIFYMTSLRHCYQWSLTRSVQLYCCFSSLRFTDVFSRLSWGPPVIFQPVPWFFFKIYFTLQLFCYRFIKLNLGLRPKSHFHVTFRAKWPSTTKPSLFYLTMEELPEQQINLDPVRAPFGTSGSVAALVLCCLDVTCADWASFGPNDMNLFDTGWQVLWGSGVALKPKLKNVNKNTDWAQVATATLSQTLSTGIKNVGERKQQVWTMFRSRIICHLGFLMFTQEDQPDI